MMATALYFFSGCEKVVQVNLNKATPQIIIQGNVTNEAGPYTVSITRSVPFDNSNVFPPVTGAVVKIKDVTAGITDILTETMPGVYNTATVQGTAGSTYTLEVMTDNKTYTASSTMPGIVVLDSVSFFINTFFGTTLTNPLPNFQDPPDADNYYFFKQLINRKPVKTFFVFDDRLSQGRYISRQLFNDSAYIKNLDTVELEMRCIDKNVYNYFNHIIEAQGGGNSGPVAAPGNPASNISNGAFGYFSAHTVQRKAGVFKE